MRAVSTAYRLEDFMRAPGFPCPEVSATGRRNLSLMAMRARCERFFRPAAEVLGMSLHAETFMTLTRRSAIAACLLAGGPCAMAQSFESEPMTVTIRHKDAIPVTLTPHRKNPKAERSLAS